MADQSTTYRQSQRLEDIPVATPKTHPEWFGKLLNGDIGFQIGYQSDEFVNEEVASRYACCICDYVEPHSCRHVGRPSKQRFEAQREACERIFCRNCITNIIWPIKDEGPKVKECPLKCGVPFFYENSPYLTRQDTVTILEDLKMRCRECTEIHSNKGMYNLNCPILIAKLIKNPNEGPSTSSNTTSPLPTKLKSVHLGRSNNRRATQKPLSISSDPRTRSFIIRRGTDDKLKITSDVGEPIKLFKKRVADKLAMDCNKFKLLLFQHIDLDNLESIKQLNTGPRNTWLTMLPKKLWPADGQTIDMVVRDLGPTI